jgi:hypothetical protein
MQRYQIKNLLAEQEKQHKQLFSNLLTAMRPLMALQTAESGDADAAIAD